jgi:hypothetical protein
MWNFFRKEKRKDRSIDMHQPSSFDADRSRLYVTDVTGGGFLVIWTKPEYGQDVVNLYGKKYDGFGSESSFKVDLNSNFPNTTPVFAPLKSGGYVLVWVEETNLAKRSIYYQVLNNKFKPRTKRLLVKCGTHRQANPTIKSLETGGFVIAWEYETRHQDGYPEISLAAKKYDYRGKEQGKKIDIKSHISADHSDHSDLSITEIEGGRLIFTWESKGNVGTEADILATVEGDDSQREFVVNAYRADRQTAPCISSLKNNNFVILWESFEPSGGQDGDKSSVYGQVFSPTATRIGEEFQVNTYVKDFQKMPDVTGLKAGGFVAAWESYSHNNSQDGDKTGVFGQVFSPTAKKIGEEFQVNTYTPGHQSGASICGIDSGGFVIVWKSWEHPIHSQQEEGIYGQEYDSLSNKKGKEFCISCK